MALLLVDVGMVWNDGTLITSEGGAFKKGPGTTDPTTPGGPVDLSPTFIIPALPFYSLAHAVVITDERDGTPIEFENFSFSTDDRSVCWTLSATGPASLFARLMAGGDLPVVRISIDGQDWLFLIEGLRRTRAHAGSSVAITGRSITITAGAPYEFTKNWINNGPATAAQLIEQAQGSSGLQVEWLLEDWLVPDKVWSFSGTPLDVVQRVAASVEAIVVSARTDNKVSVVPRYANLPHEWPTVAPDVEVHIDASMTDSYDRADKPAYNAVYVSGQQQGVVGYVRLEGTTGDLLAPLVTDLLLTDEPGVRQRGVSILGAGGPQARVQMTLPIIGEPPAPGVIEIGALCHIVDDEEEWWGVARSVAVSVDMPSATQTVTFERHTGDIEGTVVTSDAAIVSFTYAAGTLSWSVSGADTVTISGIGAVPATGSVAVSPTTTTTYLITGTNAGGSAIAAVTVSLDAYADDYADAYTAL